jgi:hypothetical protein
MNKDEVILRLKKRTSELEQENEALKKRLDFARGGPAEKFVAELTGGELTRYKDRHDVTTKSGHRLEVKLSHLNRPASSKTKRWNWDRILGLNETKEYDFLVLTGEKDERYKEQYPPCLPYVFFLVPRRDVPAIMGAGNCVALNTNLNTARANKAEVLKRYLVRSPERFREFAANAAVA